MPVSRPLLLRSSVLGILIAGFLVVDFAVPTFLPHGYPELGSAVLVGSCIAQVNLIAVWAALAQGNFMVRLPWSALLGTMMWYALVMGNRVEEKLGRFSLNDAVLLGVFLLAGIAVAQVPLWIARRVLGWQLVNCGAPVEAPARGRLQFSLQQMLLATMLLSMALAPLRTVLPPGSLSPAPYLRREMIALFTAVAICNLLVTIPCIWGAMQPVSRLLPLTMGWLFYCALLTAVEFGGLVAWLGPPGRREDTLAFGLYFYVLNLSQCATVFGTLLLLRALGFQLVRVNR
jgi:hypothetical protein